MASAESASAETCLAEFATWEDCEVRDNDGILRWEWDTGKFIENLALLYHGHIFVDYTVLWTVRCAPLVFTA